MIRKTEQPRGRLPITIVPDQFLVFSFRHFTNHQDLCPDEHPDGYTQKLVERLRALSAWTVKEFCQRHNKTVRNHKITWEETAKADGFDHLPEQLKQCEPWQFSVTANEHGRVHGFIIDRTFFVVWLDCNHRLYPRQE